MVITEVNETNLAGVRKLVDDNLYEYITDPYSEPATAYCAIEDNNVIAVIAGVHYEGLGRNLLGSIEGLIVAQPYRRKGIGTQLLFALENEWKRIGVEKVYVTISYDKMNPEPFYLANGYERTTFTDKFQKVLKV